MESPFLRFKSNIAPTLFAELHGCVGANEAGGVCSARWPHAKQNMERAL